MAENKEHDLEQADLRHEHRDVNTWAIGKFAIALVLLCGFALLVLAGLFKYFQTRENAEQGPPGAAAMQGRLPPAPRLQTNPIGDLRAFQTGEEKVLDSYGWLDQKAGTVHIPIDRAMDLVVQRGLPARTGGAPSPDSDIVPTESGLGPIMQPPGGPLAAGAEKK
jgi:hypothetical protein